MTDFEKVTDFQNMYRAFRRAKCGKGHVKSAARFDAAALDGVHKLIEQLNRLGYKAVIRRIIARKRHGNIPL